MSRTSVLLVLILVAASVAANEDYLPSVEKCDADGKIIPHRNKVTFSDNMCLGLGVAGPFRAKVSCGNPASPIAPAATQCAEFWSYATEEGCKSGDRSSGTKHYPVVDYGCSVVLGDSSGYPGWLIHGSVDQAELVMFPNRNCSNTGSAKVVELDERCKLTPTFGWVKYVGFAACRPTTIREWNTSGCIGEPDGVRIVGSGSCDPDGVAIACDDSERVVANDRYKVYVGLFCITLLAMTACGLYAGRLKHKLSVSPQHQEYLAMRDSIEDEMTPQIEGQTEVPATRERRYLREVGGDMPGHRIDTDAMAMGAPMRIADDVQAEHHATQQQQQTSDGAGALDFVAAAQQDDEQSAQHAA